MWGKRGFKEKMSKIGKIVQNRPERLLLNKLQNLGEKNAMYGKKHTEKTKKIMSEKRKMYYRLKRKMINRIEGLRFHE